MAAIGIKENIEVCPYCGAETIKYDTYSARFSCKKCRRGFSEPEVRANTPDRWEYDEMTTYETLVDYRMVKGFLASSVYLETERAALAAAAARHNCIDTEMYLDIYHCEHDDISGITCSQQDIYNEKIDDCDIFVLLIDNSEIGGITCSELMRAMEKGKPVAVFVREGTVNDPEKNIRWQNIVSEYADRFALYYSYNDLKELENCGEALCDYSKKKMLGKVRDRRVRHIYDVYITSTEGAADEFVYALCDRFNTINNEMTEEDEKFSFLFRVNAKEPWEELPTEVMDYIFIVRSADGETADRIGECYRNASDGMYIDVNVCGGDELRGFKEGLSSRMRGNYATEFSGIKELILKRGFDERIKHIRAQYRELVNGIRLYSERDDYHAKKSLLSAVKYFDAAFFYLGEIYDRQGDYVTAGNYLCTAVNKGYSKARKDLFEHRQYADEKNKNDVVENFYRTEAEKGSAEAMYRLGQYLKGSWFGSDWTEEGVKYLRLAAEKGFEPAISDLCQYSRRIIRDFVSKYAVRSLHYGQWLKEEYADIREAKEYLEREAKNGNINALDELKQLKKWLLDFEKQTKKQIKNHRSSADSGDENAQYDLGMFFCFSLNNDEGEKYLRMAAKQGHAEAIEALEELGVKAENIDTDKLFDRGISFYNAGDLRAAKKSFRIAADNGDVAAQFNLGILLADSDSLEEAEKYYRMAADRGNVNAQNNLGALLHNSGRLEEAEKYYRMAADRENVNAQNNLGVLLDDSGRLEEAEKYYRMAVDRGNVNAQNNLGILLENSGRIKEAEGYYRMSADDGNVDAQCNLGVLLKNSGRLREAEKYLRMAAEQGHAEAIEALEELKA